MTIEAVVFYLLVLDSVSANLFAWGGANRWYIKHFRLVSQFFPLAKGWAFYYLVLVLWIGSLLWRAGALGW